MSNVKVLDHDHQSGKWTSRFAPFGDLLNASQNSGTSIIFIEAKDEKLHATLSNHYSIPPTFWSKPCQQLNGFFGSHTSFTNTTLNKHRSWFKVIVKQLEEDRKFTNDRQLTKHFTSGFISTKPLDSGKALGQKAELPYVWHEMGFFSLWTPHRHVLLCFDCPTRLSDELFETLTENADVSSPPAGLFALHTKLLECIVHLYDTSIWNLANRIRGIEKDRAKHLEPSSFTALHDLARHTTHSTETVNVASDVVARIIQHIEYVTRKLIDPANAIDLSPETEALYFCHSMLSSLTERSKSNEKRLSNEINLLFNLIAQIDSKAIQVDSAAMKAIATVTLLFLPATYVSAIFSMSFFDFSPNTEPGEWRTSNKIWIYFVVAIPLTVLSLYGGHLWRKRVYNRPTRALIDLSSGGHTGTEPTGLSKRKQQDSKHTGQVHLTDMNTVNGIV